MPPDTACRNNTCRCRGFVHHTGWRNPFPCYNTYLPHRRRATASRRELAVEVGTLVIVEREVHVTQVSLVPNLRAPHDARLVERRFGTLLGGSRTVHVRFRLIVVKPERQRNIISPEQTDTGGVCADGRNIGAQCTHGTAHAHETRRSVQVVVQDSSHVILVLCACCRHHAGK